jgi:hypothetical protein
MDSLIPGKTLVAVSPEPTPGEGCVSSGTAWDQTLGCAESVGFPSMGQVAVELGFRCCADPSR